MKKAFAIFDLHVGNYNFIRNTLNNIKAVIEQGDSIHIIATKQSQSVYLQQSFLKFLEQVKLKDLLKIFYVNQEINFGENLKEFINNNEDSQIFVFKTTFPIFYYNEPFKCIKECKQQIKDNWFILQSHDVVNVPDRNGKIVKVGQQQFVSRKSQQNVAKVRNNIIAYEPDYFVFGRQFMNIVLMVNEFKQNNFMTVIDRSLKLKKPITDQNGQSVVKKYWASIQGNVNYTLIPEYMMPVVSEIDDEKITVIKFPTIVGNKYFKNSSWLGGIIGNIIQGNVTYRPNKDQSVTGMDILKNISVRYDIDANSSIYISKILKMFKQINEDIKIDFYTKNPIIKYVYQKTVDPNILSRINWIEGPYNNLANYFDYSDCSSPLKFDFNFYSVNSGDYDKSLRETMGLQTTGMRQQITGKNVPPANSDTLVRVLPMSTTLLSKDGYLSQLSGLSATYGKIKIYLEPVNIKATNMIQFEQKTKSIFENRMNKIKHDMNDEVQVQLLMYADQKQYIDKLIQIRQNNDNFYFVNRNMAFSIANNYGKQIYMGGVI